MARLTPDFITFLRHHIARIKLRQTNGWHIDEARPFTPNKMKGPSLLRFSPCVLF